MTEETGQMFKLAVCGELAFAVGSLGYFYWFSRKGLDSHSTFALAAASSYVAVACVAVVFTAVVVVLFREDPIWSFLSAAATLAMLGALFAYLYYLMGTGGNWKHSLSHTDALFVSVGTLTTAGSPGVEPQTELARRFMTIQMALDLVFVLFPLGIAVALMASDGQRAKKGA
jgi:hypothetical protein